MNKVLDSVDVWFNSPLGRYYINATPQEAFTLMSMPCLAGIVAELYPIYVLPTVSESESKE